MVDKKNKKKSWQCYASVFSLVFFFTFFPIFFFVISRWSYCHFSVTAAKCNRKKIDTVKKKKIEIKRKMASHPWTWWPVDLHPSPIDGPLPTNDWAAHSIPQNHSFQTFTNDNNNKLQKSIKAIMCPFLFSCSRVIENQMFRQFFQ